MTTMTVEKVETLDACFGTYPQTQALKSGQIKSDRVALRLTEVNPVYKAFLMMAREQKFDISEMALATYLQAKAYGKPLTLMPATMMGRFQHGTMLYNSERGTVTPESLPGRRVGVRSFAQTTGVWLRGILWKDYGLDLGKVRWVTFEDAHLAEFRDPAGVERAAEGKDMTKMVLDGELDAAIFGGNMPTDPRLKSVIPDPDAAAQDWYKKYRTVPIYPQVARSAGVGGKVVLQASVDPSGAVVATKVLSGPAMLRQAAVDALRRWKYQPGTLNGTPVAVDITVTMSFHN